MAFNNLLRIAEAERVQVNLRALKRIGSFEEAYETIEQIEAANSYSTKFVLLDVDIHTAKNLIIRHVQNVFLGRRNYNYFLMDVVSNHNQLVNCNQPLLIILMLNFFPNQNSIFKTRGKPQFQWNLMPSM